MYLRITRGLGGVKGLMVLVVTICAGIILVVAAGMLRRRMLAPSGVPARAYTPEALVALGEKARGGLPQLTYVVGDFAQVLELGPARQRDGAWVIVPEGVILKVAAAEIQAGETWVEGWRMDQETPQLVRMHASFLTRYLPVVLDGVVELAHVRLVKSVDNGRPLVAVGGWLRNIAERDLERVVVLSVFQDRDGREVDVRRSPVLELPRRRAVRFQTTPTDKGFASLSLQVTYASAEGLREYLSTVVIKRSSLQ